MIRFQVALEEPHRIYFAGEEIKGQVEVDLRESLPIQGKKTGRHKRNLRDRAQVQFFKKTFFLSISYGYLREP